MRHSDQCKCARCDSSLRVKLGCEPKRHFLSLDASTLAAVARGHVKATITDYEPGWKQGEYLSVRQGPEMPKDERLSLCVVDVGRVLPGDVSLDDSRALGYRTLLDWQRSWLGVDQHLHKLSVEARVKREDSPLWITRFTAEFGERKRLLPPTGTGYYVSSTTPQMQSAGEAVPADYQEQISSPIAAKWDLRRKERVEAVRSAAEQRRKLAFNASRYRVRVIRTANSKVREERRDAS